MKNTDAKAECVCVYIDGVVATLKLCVSLCSFVELEEPSTLGIVYMYKTSRLFVLT